MHLAVEVDVGVRDQQVHSERRTRRAEHRRQAGPGHVAVLGDHLAQHTQQLSRHLLGAAEPPPRVGVDGAAQQPGERVVLRQHRVVVGQPVDVAALAGAQFQRQRRQRAAHRVDVAGHRRPGTHDLGRLVTRCAVEVSERVDPRHRAEVDQLELLLGHHDVLGLEVVVGQPDGVQIAQRGQDFEHVADGLGDRQLLTLGLLERRPADILHHDVADRVAVLVGVLDEVVDLHDPRVRHLGEELPLGHRDRLRLGVPGMHQALEHDRPFVDVVVERQVHPAQSTVCDAALDLVLLGDHVARAQLRQKRIRTAAMRAPALGQRMAVG